MSEKHLFWVVSGCERFRSVFSVCRRSTSSGRGVAARDSDFFVFGVSEKRLLPGERLCRSDIGVQIVFRCRWGNQLAAGAVRVPCGGVAGSGDPCPGTMTGM
mmetsp:Transcript_84829/g.193468  ORF Transcript_84829/g.193468 Transcript_84829/m.193468 type:complete len:102 (+) Transcript_84829:150-455(+)